MAHESPHRLIDLLPAIFRRSEELEAFLVPFEAALFEPGGGGGGDHGSTSVEGQIGRIPSLLDADDTDEEFLPWLAQWAAISLYWEAEDRRRLVREMIPLYRMRGTREYVERVLGLYIAGTVTVEEDDLPGMAVGVPERAAVGLDSRLGEDPFRFSVRIDFSIIPAGRAERTRLVALVRAVIDLAKPAYTHYRLSHNLGEELGFVISVRSTVGVDAVLYRPGGSRRTPLLQPKGSRHERYA
jgi:phage tail-like protein